MNTHSPLPARHYRTLPPLKIDGHALYEFSRDLNRSLNELERRFGAHRRPTPLSVRKSWKPLPRKPR